MRAAPVAGLVWRIISRDGLGAATGSVNQPAADVTAAVGEITLMAPYVKTSGVIDRKRVTDAIATLERSGLITPGLTPDSVVDFALAPTG